MDTKAETILITVLKLKRGTFLVITFAAESQETKTLKKVTP